MSRTIKCTNPSCGSLITVPEGAMQVICEHCNTWHFPSDDSHVDDINPSSAPHNSYMPPPIPETGNNDDNFAPEAVPPPIPPQGGSTFDEPEPLQFDEQQSPSSDAVIAYLATNSGVRLGLKEGVNVIGRKHADLIIEDRTVSRRHCVIEINAANEGGWEYFIYDIGHMEGKSSTNGVFVSGRSLRLQDYERIPIYHGSAFRIGKVDLILQTN